MSNNHRKDRLLRTIRRVESGVKSKSAWHKHVEKDACKKSKENIKEMFGEREK